MRNLFVSACAGPAALCGLPFGIVPFCRKYVSHSSNFYEMMLIGCCLGGTRAEIYDEDLCDVPWPIVLNVILLNLLHMMISLWEIHPFGTVAKLSATSF